MRCALVDMNGDIVNVIEIDPNLPEDQQWQCPPDLTVIPHELAGTGWKLEDGKMVDKRPVPEPPIKPVTPAGAEPVDLTNP